MTTRPLIEVEKITRWVPKLSGRGGRSKVAYEARVGDMKETADTASEAKAKLTQRLWDALHGSYTPRVLRHGGWTAIIWRQPEGYQGDWSFQIIGPDDADGVRSLYGNSGIANVREAEKRARASIGANLYTPEHPFAGLEIIEDEDDRRQYLSDASWQRRYRALEHASYDGRVHETASGYDRWPEHIERPADLTDPRMKEPA